MPKAPGVLRDGFKEYKNETFNFEAVANFIGLWLFMFSLSACSISGGAIHVGGGRPVVKNGPPPHAPAHGHRAKHAYYFYPEVYVYFDISRKVYFSLEGDM